MSSIRSVFRILGVVTILLTSGAYAAPPAAQAQMATPPAPAAAAQSSFCGNQPLCYEANDFTATITDFRTSNAGGYKVIDVDVRFQNKTNQPLILTYVAGSGTALDDRGNRYGVGGGNALRGIGQSYGGNNFDPKFNLRPGGFGDAQFELLWAPGQTPYGLTFELNLTVDEINTIEGNQHTMGGEFPLHYRGLANGVTGGAPGQAFASQGQGTGTSIPGLPPCGTAATLASAANTSGAQAPANANNAVSNATTAFSNLGSLFGKKKAAATAPPAAANTASAAPCAPATGAGTTSATTMAPGTSSLSPTSANATQSTGAASTAAVPVAKAATTRNATATTTATPTTARPVAVVAKAPAAQTNATVKKAVPPPAPQKPASTTATTN